jgi:hypothetical protein
MESVPPNMTSLGTSTTTQDTMDIRSFFSCPTAVKTETIKTKTKTPKKAFAYEGHPDLETMRAEWVRTHCVAMRKVAKGYKPTKEERTAIEEHLKREKKLWRMSGRTGLAVAGYEDPHEAIQAMFAQLEKEDEEMKECQLCHEKWLPEETAGCCNDGDCPHHIETMCSKCGVWSEEEGVWRCDKCAEEDAMTYGER